jgi:hypothetical protein
VAPIEYSPRLFDATPARPHDGVMDAPATVARDTVSRIEPRRVHALDGVVGADGPVGIGGAALPDPPHADATNAAHMAARKRRMDRDSSSAFPVPQSVRGSAHCAEGALARRPRQSPPPSGAATLSWELRPNSVWRFGRAFLVCPRCEQRVTRVYVPVEPLGLAADGASA